MQNNGRDAEVEAVVAGFADRRFRHFSTPNVLTMTENWEVALGNAKGNAVFFLGDDDGLMPDACILAARLLEQERIEIVSWFPFWYFWPGYFSPDFANKLIARVDFEFFAERRFSRRMLESVYGYRATYDHLPMIYNSFVSRRVIERVRSRLGRYFVGFSPDLTSGIVNAAFSKDFVRLSRPLSITGTSQHSTGHVLNYRDRTEDFAANFSRDFNQPLHDSRLPFSNHLQVKLAQDLLFLKDLVLDDTICFNFRGLMQAIASTINDHPGAYDELMEAIILIGNKNGIDPTDVVLPPRKKGRSPPEVGVQTDGGGTVSFVFAGCKIGLKTIADAVALAAQIAPGASSLDPALRAEEEWSIPALLPGGSISFSNDSSGRNALLEGWAHPESWGTWTVGKHSRMRIKIDRSIRELTVDCIPFLHKNHSTLEVVCLVRDRRTVWEFSIRRQGWMPTIVLHEADADPEGNLEIIFLISEPTSPAILNESHDTRLLGIGLKGMSCIAEPVP